LNVSRNGPETAKPARVRVYPGFDALYYSFYLEGLEQVFGRDNLSLTARGFPRFGHHCLAFEAEGADGKTRRVYLAASDGAGINGPGLEWCDVYGKANLALDLDGELKNAAPPAELRGKLRAIGPSFPVRRWAPLGAALQAALNFARCRGQVERPREHFANYRRQYKYRLPLAAFEPSTPQEDYVFFASRLWQREPTTNRLRANFVRACHSATGLRFEGGFVPRTGSPLVGFEKEMIEKKFSFEGYLTKTQRSLVVFNTPAVASCHGWKLAEFLALGKAILSTPLSRALPAPLEHGKQIHFVDGSQRGIEEALEGLRADTEYRRRLEHGAREYFSRYLSPERVVRRILGEAFGPEMPSASRRRNS